jgi:hypothetical protein
MDETTMLITLAVIFGFIGGALARQPKLRQLASEKAALIEQCGELFSATLYFQRINQQLGRAMEAAGLDVQRIGECDCGECDEEWPDTLEEVSQ